MQTQTQGDVSGIQDADLRDISLSLERVERGELSERAAFDAISRVVRRRSDAPAEIYQKPLG